MSSLAPAESAAGAATPAGRAGRSRRAAGAIRRADPQVLVGSGALVAFVVVAVLASVLAPDNPTAQVGRIYAAPSVAHLLGLDNGGHDIVSQLLYGARTSLLVGFVASAVGMLVGGGVGLVSGYVGGRTDSVLMRITDYFLVIPDIPLMIVAAAVFGQSLRNIIIIIGLIYWTTAARVIRAQVKSLRQRGFVRRARLLGASDAMVLRTHVLPQVASLLVANTVLQVANAVFAETYISFLGLGDPSTISWGSMIQDSLQGGAIFYRAWWDVLPPGLAVTVVVLACTLVGQGLEDALNPRLRVGHLAVRRFRLQPLARVGGDDGEQW
ncbi:MAG: ABC transporter permease [Acidimicrobiales bacterium]